MIDLYICFLNFPSLGPEINWQGLLNPASSEPFPLHINTLLPGGVGQSKAKGVTMRVCVYVYSRNGPPQGNSILALSGLAVSLAKFESNLPADCEDCKEVPVLPSPSIIAGSVAVKLTLDCSSDGCSLSLSLLVTHHSCSSNYLGDFF